VTEASSLGSLVDPNATNVACARDPPPPPRALLLALRMFEREKEGSQTCPAGDLVRSQQGSTSTIIRPPSSERREGSKSIPTSPTTKSPSSRTARVRYWLPRLPLACFASFASARGSYLLYPRLVQPLASRASQRSTGRRLSVFLRPSRAHFSTARSLAGVASCVGCTLAHLHTQPAQFAPGLLGQTRRRGDVDVCALLALLLLRFSPPRNVGRQDHRRPPKNVAGDFTS
jgi:hypothetical protein